MPEIGVTLREYISNCEEVNKAIPEKDRANDNLTKLLGSIYDKTKFDPIGIADPLTIRLKHLMREIYEINISWKEPVPKHLAIKWFDTCQELNAVSITLPRYLGNPAGISGKTTLWVFADASAKALATCAFFRDEESKERTNTSHSKKTKQTIARLELVVILLAIRLAKTITFASKIVCSEIYILSDSEVALYWIEPVACLNSLITKSKASSR
ncbi:unnamed protein product [Heligmosomoides polygyrus]|uniref:RT_RNaseH_2 domain-containing protein n=1 Tax=Heligmosomoides polygyrus TaxID=6339 RepID=A0A3P8FKK2_HELPZ|nr:unnamed protein product [Heligmosomoides polygyrus]